MIANLRKRLQGGEIGFLRSSLIVTVGFAFARVLGIGFSFVLAAILVPDVYGFIQYNIAISLFLTIGTMPLAQHLLARQISVLQEEPEQLDQFISSFMVLMALVVLLTLLIAVPVLFFSESISLVGVLIIFLGTTIFYLYYGAARGFVASVRLAAVFIGSNLIQLVLIVVIYEVLVLTSPVPALVVYGLSYLAPVGLLYALFPFPLRFQFSLVRWSHIREQFRSAVPLWLSQAGFVLGSTIDIMLVQRFINDRALGAYTFTRQLCIVFDFIPMGIHTVLMPKIAAAKARATRRRYLVMALGAAVVVNSIAILGFLVVYPLFVGRFYSEYLLPLDVVFFQALAQSIWGVHGILTSAFIGLNRASMETMSRALLLIVLTVSGLILVPQFGVRGAALMSLIGSIAAVASYPLLLAIPKLWRRLRNEPEPTAHMRSTIFGTE